MNVPKLRFKEFNDEWKKTTLQNLTFIIDGDRGKNYPKENEFYNREYCLFLNAGNVTKNGFDFSNNTFITKKKDEILRNGKLLKEDIVLTTRGTVGNVAYYNENIPYQNIRINSGMVIIRINNNNICSKYLYSYMKSPQFSLQVTKSNFGSAQPQLTVKGLSRFTISYPLIKEQEKLSFFINLLDKKIELQSKKIEALKLYKLSQIRDFFKKNNFESCKLKDIGQFISSNSIGKEKITNTGVPLILYGDLYTKYNETIQDIKQFCDDNEKYVKSELNDLIFPTSTTVDAISLISPSSVKVNGAVYGGDIIIFKPNIKDINSDFLSFEINNYLKKYFSTFAQGSTIIHIQADNLLNCNVLLPNIKIQTKLANCFNLYNRKIKLEEEKLSKLESLKKGLMQNMFV